MGKKRLFLVRYFSSFCSVFTDSSVWSKEPKLIYLKSVSGVNNEGCSFFAVSALPLKVNQQTNRYVVPVKKGMIRCE